MFFENPFSCELFLTINPFFVHCWFLIGDAISFFSFFIYMQLDDFLASFDMSFLYRNLPLVLLLFVQKLCYQCTFDILFVRRWIAYTFIVQSQD